MTFRLAIAIAAALSTACDARDGTLPTPPPLARWDGGYPVTPRPECSKVVLAAVRQAGIGAIVEAAKGRANFTCGPSEEPTPLDDAVRIDDIDRVRALLEAGADPNARWGTRGDHSPLQEAIEHRNYGNRSLHRTDIVRQLLGSRYSGCTADAGITPLMLATSRVRQDIADLLIKHGFDAAAKDWMGRTAREYAPIRKSRPARRQDP